MTGTPTLVLVGGAAGVGKSTVARRWCELQARAVHIELDRVREMIVGGRLDPRRPGPEQARQYATAVEGCVALARVFLDAGYQVVVCDVLDPHAFYTYWRGLLADLPWRLVVLDADLAEILDRAVQRPKYVPEEIIRSQHQALAGLPSEVRLDVSTASLEEAVEQLDRFLGGRDDPPCGD